MTNDFEAAEKIEGAVVRALERRPEVPVPEDFAAKMVCLLPPKERPRTALRPIYGHIAGYIGAVLTMIVLAVLTRSHPEAIQPGQGFLFGVEMLLVAQLLAVGYWLGMKGDESRK